MEAKPDWEALARATLAALYRVVKAHECAAEASAQAVAPLLATAEAFGFTAEACADFIDPGPDRIHPEPSG